MKLNLEKADDGLGDKMTPDLIDDREKDPSR